MKVLIIDDSEYKIESLRSVLNEWGNASQVEIARSFNRGMNFLKQYAPELVLLDMTLPTYERGDGRMRLLGGRELLAEMDFLGLNPKVIVVTQFDHFGDPPNSVDLVTLLETLRREFQELVVGGVYYNNINSDWREELMVLLNEGVL